MKRADSIVLAEAQCTTDPIDLETLTFDSVFERTGTTEWCTRYFQQGNNTRLLSGKMAQNKRKKLFPSSGSVIVLELLAQCRLVLPEK